uniref:Beta-1,3-galactosyl-O-glycosyl-glycoprotein beta-1,6-N-acetylglucosaminyltransferase 3-like n=1 Tax=Bursaphelenchus xylophilus TaxID=6326 RepID=A0A1I7SMI1_BURXY
MWPYRIIHRWKTRWLLVLLLVTYFLLFVFHVSWSQQDNFGRSEARGTRETNSSHDDIDCDRLAQGVDEKWINEAELWIPNKESVSSVYPNADRIDCQALHNLFDFPRHPLSESESIFPLSYGFHVYKNIYQVLSVLSAFYHPQNFYCIGVDGKSPKIFKNQVKLLEKCLPNITVIEFPKVKWCTIGTLKALYGCFEYLTKASHPWQYYQYISNHDLPLKTNFEMVQLFKALNGAIITEVTRRNKIEEKRFELPLYKSSMSAVISREAANYAVTNARVKVLFKEISKARLPTCPDEVLWGTLFGNKKLFPAPGSFDLPSMRDALFKSIKGMKMKEPIVKLNDAKEEPFNLVSYYIPRYQVWAGSRRRCHGKHVHTSCVYGIKDIPTLLARPELVAHKLYADYQPAAFYCLRKLVKERAHHPDQRLFKGKVYSQLAHVRILNGDDPSDVQYFH